MLVDFQQHYTPPDLFKGDPAKATVDLDRDGNPSYFLNPLLADLSAHVRMSLLSRGPFVTALPGSLLRFNAAKFALKVLPVDLTIHGYPVAILTLKNRALSPLVGLFIQHIHEAAESIIASHSTGVVGIDRARSRRSVYP